MALTTLDAMAAGGIYDHLVGGFCRYSTDNRWLVPHFEKMLTDQALLARAYLHAWQETGQDNYLAVVTETLDFVLRDLSTPEGALYSSFDADAGGVEGSHATFTLAELARRPPRAPRRTGGRVVRDHRRAATGRAAPSRAGRSARPSSARPTIEEARRCWPPCAPDRVQPARDEKVLTEWNAMAAATLAEVAAVTGSDRLRPTGRGDRRVPHVRHVRRRPADAELAGRPGPAPGRGRRPRLAGRGVRPAVRAHRQGASGATGPTGWRRAARPVLGRGAGGFFTTGDDAESARSCGPRSISTGPCPPPTRSPSRPSSGPTRSTTTNGLRQAVERTVARGPGPCSPAIPGALADLVAALPMLAGRQEIVVTGERPDLLAEVRRHWLPAAVVAWGEPDGSPLFAGRPDGAAFVCRGFTCDAPADDVTDLGRPTRGAAPMTDDAPRPTRPRPRPGGRQLGPERAPPRSRTDPARLLRRSARRREKIPTSGGSTLHLLVLSSTVEDTTVVDLATRTVMRVRVPWPENYEPDITAFDVVEVTLADDPERDDLAQPEATTAADLPRHVGTLRGRQLRKLLRRMVASPEGPAARVPRALGPLLGVPRLPALGGPHRADPQPAAHPPRRRTGPPGCASDGTATTSGSRSRIAMPPAPSMPPAASASAARAWPPPSASTRSTCW